MTFNFYRFPWRLWFKCEYNKTDLRPTFNETFYWFSVGPLVITKTVKHG